MKKVGLVAVLAAGLLAGSAFAATVSITAPDGGNLLDLSGSDNGDMQIRVTTVALDTIQLAFLNAFLDTTGSGIDADSVDVVGVTAGNGAPWIYDRSAFEDKLPVDIDESGAEYGLVSGDPTQPSGGYPLGPATYVHDTIHLMDTNGEGAEGDVFVTFELGARAPNATGPGPTFAPFFPGHSGFPPNFPNTLYVGNDTGGNPQFVIHVPEPAALGVLAFGGLAALRRRR
jgi:hypothetical protein